MRCRCGSCPTSPACIPRGRQSFLHLYSTTVCHKSNKDEYAIRLIKFFQRFMFIAQIFPSELRTVECCLVLVVDGFPNYKIMGDNAFLSFSTGALVPSMTWPKLPCLAFYLRLFSTLFPNPHDRSHLKQFNTIAWIFSNSPPRIFWLFFRQSVIAEKWQWGTGGGQRLSIVTLNMCPHTCLSSAVKTPR